MQFRTSLIIAFALVVAVSVGVTAYLAESITTESVIDAELQEMQRLLFEKENVIAGLHHRAISLQNVAVQPSVFDTYFELDETKAGNVYDDGVIQFTPQQKELKKELDTLIFKFQEHFVVDETCLIDHTGQEHTRLVHGDIAPDSDLSSAESDAPFFKSSFALDDGESYIQYPYVSPDTHRWVFAYTTPIVLDDGSKPAIFHFEMPIEIFQSLVHIDVGRMYVLDHNGYVIADSDDSVPTDVKSIFHAEHFPSIQQAFAYETFPKAFETMKTNGIGMGMYDTSHGKNFYVYDTLDTFNWIIVYERPESLMLAGSGTSLDELRTNIGITGTAAIIGGIVAAVIISTKISRPIHQLSESVSTENPERLELLGSSNSDEVNKVTFALNRLIMQVNEHQERIHMQKRELEIQSVQLERLAKVGELSSRLTHNLRNPLTVIRTTLELLKIKIPDDADPKTLDRIERIERATLNMSKQIEEVLTYVRNKPLDVTSATLNDLINNALDNLDVSDTLKIEKPSNDITISCDADKLTVVFMNLITNAAQAMDNNGRISFYAEKSNNEIIIRVQDEGPGIPSESLEKVFDTLFTTKSTGTGLGLPYCKSVIEQHGGSISVTTTPTTFTIVLPTKIVQKENLE